MITLPVTRELTRPLTRALTDAGAGDLAAAIRALFANGEQGGWYDPSDMSTMYQDAAGTTPVYMPGQGQVDPPVGLLFDKRLGLVRGPDMVTNGDFATAAGWSNTSGSDWTFGTGAAVRTATVTANGFETSIPTHVAGMYYLVSFEVTAVTNAGVGISAYLGAASSPPVTSPGKYSFFIRSDGTSPNSLRFYPRGASNFFAGSIDNISLQAIPGNHAYQTTTTSRPTLSARYNLLRQSEATYQAPWGFVNTSGSATQTLNTYTFGSSPLDRVRQTSSAIPANTTIAASAVLSGSGNVRLVLIHGDGSGSTSLAVTLTDTPTSYVLTVSNPAAGASGGVGIYNNAAGLPGAVVNVHRTDLRPTNDGVGLPPYQRVDDANTYDTVGFPLYLKFDGVDDFLQTTSVNFSGTDKLFASAALRKFSDAAAGIVVELSLVSNSNPGAFALLAPAAANPTLGVYLRGATTVITNVPSGIASPASRVFTGVFDLAAAITQQARSRINGQPSGVSTIIDAGGGVFGSYPVYIGRRGGASIPFNGRLYSLLIRGAATPDATIAAVESYLNQKARIY